VALQDILIRRMRRDGALSVADFMGTALFHPEQGYYARRAPIGQAGDFTTAPEVHQMFGEMIAAWLVDYWDRSGRPAPFLLVELGPGRGTLMRDIQRTAAGVAPSFARAARIWFVETSSSLRGEQAVAVPAARFTDNLAAVPAAFALVVANEFFDALPIHQYVKTGRHWRERTVIWDGSSSRFVFALAPHPSPVTPHLPGLAGEGDIVEISPAAQAVAADLAGRAVAHGGASLIIDYARDPREPCGTLQAVRSHRRVDPLSEPGAADLSARVDFQGLATTARAAGASVHGPRAQGAFLEAVGIRERGRRLAAMQPAARESIEGALRRLTGPEGMGSRFQAMSIAGPLGPAPAGFA
jgi:NADH dehydrogenase [ubiquinone] 1 alpha subcomplex assembly factor 7